MRFVEDWKKRIFFSILIGFVFATILSNILYFLSLVSTDPIRTIAFHSLIFVLFGLILGIFCSIKGIIRKRFWTIALSALIGILFLIIAVIITYFFSQDTTVKAYGLFGLSIIAPFIIIVFIIFGLFFNYIQDELTPLDSVKLKLRLSVFLVVLFLLLLLDIYLSYIRNY